jgi:hypothetical protein
MNLIRSALVGLFTLLAALTAAAQQFQTVPAQSFIGRLGLPGDTGPSQAIPLTQLFSNVTISGGIGNFTTGLSLNKTQVTPTAAIVQNLHPTGSGTAAVWTATSSNGSASFGVGGPAYTNIPILQNRAYVDSQATLNGIAINTEGAKAIVFGINNAEVARFTSLGGFNLTPVYQAGNPANAASLWQVPNPTAGFSTIFNGYQFSVGTPLPATSQFGGNTAALEQALVATLNVPLGDTVGGFAFMGIAKTLNGFPANVIGSGGLGYCGVANSSCWGGNDLVQNTNGGATVPGTGFNVNWANSLELNVNMATLPGGADPTVGGGGPFAIYIRGDGDVVGPLGQAVNVGILNGTHNAKWVNGFHTDAGAAVNAYVAGPAGIGASQNSQPFVYNSTNGASTVLVAKSFSDSAGSIAIDPFPNAAINLRDGNVASPVTLFSTSAGYGGSGVKVNALSTAGIVTNTSAGVVGTLAGTATTVLHGNAAGLPTYSAVDLASADVINSLSAINGGTGQTAYQTGDTIYAPFANALFRLPGNTTTAKQYLSQTGTGTVSAAPAWATIAGADITGAALTKTDDTNVTLTLGGTPATAALRAVSFTLGWTGGLANSRLATMATNTVKGNATSGTASPTDLAVASCSTAASALIWTTNTGFGCNTSITAAAMPATGLTGTLQAAQEPAHTGDVTNSAGNLALAIGATKVTSAMLNADVFSTAHSWAGQQTFVAPILGTPASGDATNLIGTAAGLTTGHVTTNANSTGDVTSVGNATTFTGKVGGALGQIPGTATNDNATAGNLGEYVENVVGSGSPIAIVTGTPKTITSIPLTAGDWDVDTVGSFLPAATTSTTGMAVSISGTTNTLDSTPGKIVGLTQPATVTGGTANSLSIPPYRLSLSGTTTVFLVLLANFSVSTAGGYGIIRARRVR